MKNELIRSLQEIEVSEDEELDQQAEKATNQEEAIPVVQDYEKIVRSKIKFFLNVAGKSFEIQGPWKIQRNDEGT